MKMTPEQYAKSGRRPGVMYFDDSELGRYSREQSGEAPRHETRAELQARIAAALPALRKQQQEKARLEAIGGQILRREAAVAAWLKTGAGAAYRKRRDSDDIKQRHAQTRK
jgi:hypothetical protein